MKGLRRSQPLFITRSLRSGTKRLFGSRPAFFWAVDFGNIPQHLRYQIFWSQNFLHALEISCILLILSAPSLSLGPLSTLFPFPFLSQLRESKLFGCSLYSLCILSSVRHHTQVCRLNKGLLRMSMSYTPESISVLCFVTNWDEGRRENDGCCLADLLMSSR